MSDVKLGINLWSQASDWPGFLDAARRADQLGYEHIWTWDHILAIFGDPHQDIFEGYTALAAVAQATQRMLVGTWTAAEWAIRFYRRNGFELVSPGLNADLLRRYWDIPERQIETSSVLADPPYEAESGAGA